MPQIETWSRLPAQIRDHLVERMHDRNIRLEDLNQLRVWIESKPIVPEGRSCDTQPSHPQPHQPTIEAEAISPSDDASGA
jgi:hypothetical protein